MGGRSFGVILLAIYLILTGLFALTNFTVVFAGVIMGLLAIGAGIFLGLGK